MHGTSVFAIQCDSSNVFITLCYIVVEYPLWCDAKSFSLSLIYSLHRCASMAVNSTSKIFVIFALKCDTSNPKYVKRAALLEVQKFTIFSFDVVTYGTKKTGISPTTHDERSVLIVIFGIVTVTQ